MITPVHLFTNRLGMVAMKTTLPTDGTNSSAGLCTKHSANTLDKEAATTQEHWNTRRPGHGTTMSRPCFRRAHTAHGAMLSPGPPFLKPGHKQLKGHLFRRARPHCSGRLSFFHPMKPGDTKSVHMLLFPLPPQINVPSSPSCPDVSDSGARIVEWYITEDSKHVCGSKHCSASYTQNLLELHWKRQTPQ